MGEHNVKQGDCISSIADQHGFFWDSLWEHPSNARLKKLRQNPNALLPGDVVVIPDKRRKEEQCQATKRHKFRLKGVPVRFKLKLLDENDQPRAGIPYTLVVDGKTARGVTPEDGNFSEIIKPNAKKAKLTLKPPEEDEEVYEFDLGHMNPADNIEGLQGRLQNLGYYEGAVSGEMNEQATDAIKRFQAQAGLPETGTADEATRSALIGRHGG